MQQCLLHMNPLMNEQQDHVILVEDEKTMNWIDFQCVQENDKELGEIQHISDRKWK